MNKFIFVYWSILFTGLCPILFADSNFQNSRQGKGIITNELKDDLNSGKTTSYPFAFCENKGQITGFDHSPHPEIKYYLKENDLQIFLLDGGITYQINRMHYPKELENLFGKKLEPKNLNAMNL